MKHLIQVSLVAAAVILAGKFTVQAHEGHDHDAPKVVAAPKGGLIQPIQDGYVEVVAKGKDLKVYIYDQAVKIQPTASLAAKLTIGARAILPRTKGPIDLTLKTMPEYFETTFDAKSTHRYTLVISVAQVAEKQSTASKPNELKFTIEPRK